MADKPKRIPINTVRSEEGAHGLASSPDMEPYLRFITAAIQGSDPTPELEHIRELPLERRYVWRVASALKWAFADLETESVAVDRQTLSPEDLAKVVDLLKLRPVQMALFLAALVGGEEMQRMMTEAIRAARRQG
jgi:hypothetical protein